MLRLAGFLLAAGFSRLAMMHSSEHHIEHSLTYVTMTTASKSVTPC
jgi:hypothetical protein